MSSILLPAEREPCGTIVVPSFAFFCWDLNFWFNMSTSRIVPMFFNCFFHCVRERIATELDLLQSGKLVDARERGGRGPDPPVKTISVTVGQSTARRFSFGNPSFLKVILFWLMPQDLSTKERIFLQLAMVSRSPCSSNAPRRVSL